MDTKAKNLLLELRMLDVKALRRNVRHKGDFDWIGGPSSNLVVILRGS